MNSDDIIELAQQCGIWIPIARGPERALTIERLRRFAALVAAAERAAVRHEADCVEACKSEIERLRAENVGLVDDMNLLRDNNTALRARIEAVEKQEPMGTLHDDGCFVWRETAPHQSNHAGWKMALYALPGAQAQPAPSVPAGVAEAMQRLIENGAVLGPASSEDALLVARYRKHLLSSAPNFADALRPVITWLRNGCDPAKAADELELIVAKPAPSVPDGWQLVPTAESRHPGIYKMLGALHAADNTPGMSEWESYQAMLAEAPKPEG